MAICLRAGLVKGSQAAVGRGKIFVIDAVVGGVRRSEVAQLERGRCRAETMKHFSSFRS